MKSEWTEYRVSKTPVDPANGEYVYTVCRKRIDGVDHSGNREVAGVYGSKEKAENVVNWLNKKASDEGLKEIPIRLSAYLTAGGDQMNKNDIFTDPEGIYGV